MTKSEKNDLGLKIMKCIEQKDAVSRAELKKLGDTRNSVKYHLKKLCKNGKLHVFAKNAGLTDEDIFYSIVSDKYPRDIKEIKGLIEKMSDKDLIVAVPAYEEFINLCMSKWLSKENSEQIAIALICKVRPLLEEQVMYIFATMPSTRRELNDAAYARKKTFKPFEDLLKSLVWFGSPITCRMPHQK